MMSVDLNELEPKLLWNHFLALAAIPRGSKNEQAVAAHVVAEGKRLGLPVKQDAVGNVLITKPGTKGKESAPTMILQGHLDMVCEKNSDVAHDFTKDPIRLVRDGDFVRASGTTLGADNGIGCAAALAVLESKDVAHGPLECLFTIDEETGMTGAFHLSADFLKGKRMLNLDTEEEGAVYIGCAGGMDSVARTRAALVAPGAGKAGFRLKVTGLRGGHSGVDIHEGRANALKFLGRALRRTVSRFGLEVASVDGGSKRNAIPREAFALVAMAPAQADAIGKELAALTAELRAEYGKIEPGITIAIEAAGAAPAKVFAAADTARIVNFLHASIHGMLAMSPDIPGLVQTSTNLAIIETAGDVVTVSMSHRSSVDSAKKDVGQMIAAHCELAGFTVEQGDGYPGWAPNVSSPLLKLSKEVHAKLFGKEPEIKAIHAGLECGIIGEKYPGLDVISFGPTIQNAHSPTEQVSIPSVAGFWKYLQAFLAAA
jgi:dipeptidase D